MDGGLHLQPGHGPVDQGQDDLHHRHTAQKQEHSIERLGRRQAPCDLFKDLHRLLRRGGGGGQFCGHSRLLPSAFCAFGAPSIS